MRPPNQPRASDRGEIASGEAFGRPTVGAAAPSGIDETLAGGAAQGSREQANLDASRKSYLTLQAQLALRAFTVSQLADSSYLVCRWDCSVHCSDLAQVRAFLGRID